MEGFIANAYQEQVKQVLDKALAGESTKAFEFPIFSKGGNRIEILLNANPRRDDTGAIVGVVGVGQDITERIAQEQEHVRLIDTSEARADPQRAFASERRLLRRSRAAALELELAAELKVRVMHFLRTAHSCTRLIKLHEY